MALTMKDAVRETNLSPDTLKKYERLGLLKPARDSSGRRQYSASDMQEAKRIAADMAQRHAAQIANLHKQSKVTTP
jgi:DNA-binding transcriptional MerR regulator